MISVTDGSQILYNDLKPFHLKRMLDLSLFLKPQVREAAGAKH